MCCKSRFFQTIIACLNNFSTKVRSTNGHPNHNMHHICSLSQAHSQSARSCIDSTKLIVVSRSFLRKYVFVLMLWANHLNLLWISAKCFQPPKLQGSLTRNKPIVLRDMAPNHLIPRQVSPSQGLVNNSGPNCFKMHLTIGQISRGDSVMRCSRRHLYANSSIFCLFTCFFPQTDFLALEVDSPTHLPLFAYYGMLFHALLTWEV